MTDTINSLFEVEIRDLYDAEKQLVKALPKMAEAAMSEELRSGFEEHLQATKGHVSRLEEVFQSIDVKPKGKTCEAMKGLVAEGQQAVEENKESELRDIMLIGAAKRVEHYEIAAYQTVIKLAESMGNETASELLRETLSEEEETDEKLDTLCEDLLEIVASSSGDKETPTTGSARTRRAG
jgi:ferritin-like metal-binding protein YciE